MKKVNLFLIIIVLFASCNTTKFLTSDVKPLEITEMLKIQPFSYISLVEQGNRGVFNDSISNEAQIALNETLEIFRDRIRLSSTEVILTDSAEISWLEQEIDYLIISAERNRNVKNIAIPPFIESLLTANDERFGLIIVQSGFTRTRGNYGGQVAKQIGVGILTGLLTGVAHVQTPVKSGSTLHAIIVDNQNKNVAFYNNSVLQDREPTNKETITRHLNEIFRGYFWK